MRRPVSTWRILLVAVLTATTGCTPTQPFYLCEDGDLSHYIDKATAVEHPDLHTDILQEVTQSQRPLSVSHPEFREFWDLSLEECVSIALNNTKVVRGGSASVLQNGQIQPGTRHSNLVEQPLQFSTTYNPAVVESNPGQAIGGISNFMSPQGSTSGTFNGPTTDGGIANVRQGVEAALAQFDAQLNVISDAGSPIMFKQDRPQNVVPSSTFFPNIVRLRGGGTDASIVKRTAEGTVFSITSSTDYTNGNQRGFPQTQPFLHTWTQVIQLEARHPLLRGRGSQINRMPIIIARIGTDIELTALQGDLQEMLNNVEIRYWDLYLAYRNLETAKVARDSALVTWRIVFDKFQAGNEAVQSEAQSQEQYYNFRSQVEQALRTLNDTENELRLLMGLGPTDGRLIRPKDDPTLARVEFDWTDIVAEGVARRPELNQQRWRVKQRELELILARNQLLPQLDIGAQYRWVGVGEDLINSERRPLQFPAGTVYPPTGLLLPQSIPIEQSAWQSLTGGDFQEYSLLFQFQLPIGFRRELAGVRHAQLRMARDKALLEDMELDVSHSLSHSLRNLETNFQLAQTNANRWAASQREVEALDAQNRGGRVSLDLALEAQRRRAVAQASFWSAVIEYNKSIADIHTKKGSILDYDGIGFEEGPWPKTAYWDALARARERDAGWYIDYGWTRPKVVSRGPVPQGVTSGSPMAAVPGTAAEERPTPEPTPAAPPPSDTNSSPLPTPRIVPQETRTQPRPATQRTVAAGEASFESDDQPPAVVPAKRSSAVVPAGYISEATGGDANPLRGGRQRPIGSGVAEQ
jgi:outer membrane protein TolC